MQVILNVTPYQQTRHLRALHIRPYFIDVVVDMSIFENNQMTLFLCFSFRPKAGMGQTKTGGCFYCVVLLRTDGFRFDSDQRRNLRLESANTC